MLFIKLGLTTFVPFFPFMCHRDYTLRRQNNIKNNMLIFYICAKIELNIRRMLL